MDIRNLVCTRLMNQTLVLIGIYDIWVKRGVVSIMGAKLHPSPDVCRVYAPSTHSLPVIKCVSSVEGYAEIELQSCSTNLDRLKEISPLYNRIWNSGETPGDRSTFKGSCKRSFSIVSFHIIYFQRPSNKTALYIIRRPSETTSSTPSSG